jgi:hypothetical protein
MILGALMALTTQEWVVYEGGPGPGKGKHIVFLSGDEEYRSEEGLPQLAKILAKRHGFKCTVLFSINKNGEIDPNTRTNEPGMAALDSADLCVMLLRFRAWPDEQMRHFVDYFNAGKPIVALRTSTHAFDYPEDSTSSYKKFGWSSKEWPGGFGKQVLGENWVSHWGNHGSQGTRGLPAGHSPLLNGVKDVFGSTDVYEAAPPTDATVVLRGEVVEGMKADDPRASGKKRTAQNVEQDLDDPMMPIAWTREQRNRVFVTTMGAATDLLNPGLRRLLVNACYWGIGLSAPSDANVDFVGTYQPSPFGFDGFKRGVKPDGIGADRRPL